MKIFLELKVICMNINIYMIAKKSSDEYDKIINGLIKNSSKFAKVQIYYIFNKEISKAQTIGEIESKKSYTNAYEKYLPSGYNIALDVKAKKVDTFEFANMIENNANINFFIGGAFGFEEKFIKKCNKSITLSDLTMAHKIATLVLTEQIFRALCIKNNHPYHK